jgi:hypothetical protein
MPGVTEPTTSGPPTSRRTLAKAAVAATVGVGAVGAAVRLGQDDDTEERGGALVLSAEGGSDIAELEVPLELGRARNGVRETESLPTSLYSMVGVTWRGDASPEVWARARRSDGWTDWTRLPVLEDRPEDDAWQADRRGTAAWWVGPSRAVQVRVAGAAPKGMRLVLLHPAGRTSDQAVGTAARRSTGAEDVVAPKPDISSRAAWGADESWRDGRPRYESTIEQVHVHHTASGNDYSRSDTPALIRGMYRYHTKSLGWSDIAYNFLVDRFGRIWEGRAGGVARPVRGAHTLGFNSDSCGIAVIGNFDQVKASDTVVRGVAAVAAWKLDRYGRRARGRTTVRSEGSDKYRDGAMATLRVIDGHRDTNDTSCPGTNLYKRLPDIRARAHEIMTAPPPPSNVTVQDPARVGGAALVGRGLKALKGRYDPDDARTRYQWLVEGREISGEKSWRYQCREADLGRTVSVRVTSNAPGRDPVIEVVEAGRVKAPVEITLKTRRRGGRVRAKVAVRSPDGIAADPGGTVTLSIGNRVVERRVRDLDKAIWFGRGKPLADRATRLVVVYSGDQRFLPREVRRSVRP